RRDFGMPDVLRAFFQRLATSFGPMPRSGSVLLWILRGLFGAIVIGMAWVAYTQFVSPAALDAKGQQDPTPGVIAFFTIIGIGFLVLLADVLIRNKQITTVSAVYFGLLLGLLLGTFF